MDKILEVQNVKKHFTMARGLIKKRVMTVKAVDDVSFDLYRGEVFGLVGESGSGKTTMARLVLRLTQSTENSILLDGTDIFQARGRVLSEVRRKMSVVFQDPAASLNPRTTIGDSLRRPLEVHGVPVEEAQNRIAEVTEQVSLGRELLSRYPHQVSGGQQQRASIARALVLEPKLLVLDEPTSALDVSVQAQILNLFLDLQTRYDLTYLFITHNLSVVRYVCDRIGVMYLGKIMEIAPVDDLYSRPLHPYTMGLLSSAPVLDPRMRNRRKLMLSGEPPSLINPPTGCRLAPRCPFAEEACHEAVPPLEEVEPGHWVACRRVREIDFKPE